MGNFVRYWGFCLITMITGEGLWRLAHGGLGVCPARGCGQVLNRTGIGETGSAKVRSIVVELLSVA